MKTSFVSNLAVQNAMRLTIQQGQLEMMKLQYESTEGKFADTGASLGSTTSRAVSLKAELERLDNLKTTNSIATQRLAGSQAALTTMRSSADELNTALLSVMDSEDSQKLSVASTSVKTALSAFVGAANAQFNGEYLMAGINTDVQPLTDYGASTPAEIAFRTARDTFMADNNIATLKDFTPEQMSEFITTKLEPMFAGTGWTDDWSKASDQNVQSRITPSEVVASTTNTNTDGVKKFMLAAVLAKELLGAGVSSEVRDTVNRAAQNYVQQSKGGLIEMSSALGVSEGRIKKANTTLENQMKIISTHVADIEGVDPYEAATRLTALRTQIETSYTLTARLQELSLINYL